MGRMKFLLSFCLALGTLALCGQAQEWTRFRGPNGTGISNARTIPTAISAADINWKVELPGVGHSSPVLWGDRVFLTTSGDGGGLSVLCVNAADGKQLWKH